MGAEALESLLCPLARKRTPYLLAGMCHTARGEDDGDLDLSELRMWAIAPLPGCSVSSIYIRLPLVWDQVNAPQQ